ncbi:MAG: ankyrin repeat domain-containing protein [Gemmatimonadales bacterium]
MSNESGSIDDRLFDAARSGNVGVLAAILDDHPEKLNILTTPHEQTMLHLAAAENRLDAVNFLLDRGLDVNARDSAVTGDNTYPMHWAAAAGNLDVVRRLADAGGDVVGHGDDHGLEVIGWATGWDGCDDETHRQLADFLVSRGAPHNIWSAIAMNLPNEVRRIVKKDSAVLTRGQSHNENDQVPLHFAAKKNRPDMIHVLVELGADASGKDPSGVTPLHLASGHGHADAVRALLSLGADPTMRDTEHDSDPIGWAEYFEKPEIVEILKRQGAGE